MNLADAQRLILEPMFTMLPPHMDTPAARAMLLAIGLQECNFSLRKQIKGPARGYWQFEGHDKSALAGLLKIPAVRETCMRLDYAPKLPEIYQALEDNDLLAAYLARQLLWTVPERLPSVVQVAEGYRQYTWAWRPGKPRPNDWPANYIQAWRAIDKEVA